MKKSFANNPFARVVMMCDEKEYNPQGGSLLACTVTQGSLLSSATLGYRK